MIIAFCGESGTGKDTAASVLIENHDYARVSFAYPLKMWCSQFTGVPYYCFENRDTKDHIFKEPIVFVEDDIEEALSTFPGTILGHEMADKMRASINGVEFKSLRHIMQYFGKEVARDIVDDNIWLNIAKESVERWEKDNIDVAITDCRFNNEADMIKNKGGRIIQIIRPSTNKEKKDTHSSENIDFSTDDVIMNTGTIQDLCRNVESLCLKENS